MRKRVFKQKVRCEWGQKAITYGDLQPGPWLAPALAASTPPDHHGSDREGQAVMGFTKRNHLGLTRQHPKIEKSRPTAPERDGLLGRRSSISHL